MKSIEHRLALIVYFIPGHDDFNDAMVAAKSRESAARSLPFSPYQLDAMGWSVLPADSADAALASSLPGHVFFRPRGSRVFTDWRMTRWTRDEVADIASCGSIRLAGG